MGCCGSKTPKHRSQQDEIARPFVTREKTSQKVDSDTHLPLGVLLTGGNKLHSENLLGSNVRVAVIDSGVDKDHPGFNNMVTKQHWYRDGTPLEQDDHGTHVAGTIHLLAPQAEIYDYRVFGERGKLGVTEAIAAAIYEAVKDKCHVINMSLGGPVPNSAIHNAVQHAKANGVICVCAAGNEGDNNPLTNEISYPASFEECISVAAVSKKDGLPVARFSNSNPQVDYAGIGVDVISFQPGSGFQKMSGTSMASPHVAGFIACLMTNDDNVVRRPLHPLSNKTEEWKNSETDDKLRQMLSEQYAIDIGKEGPDTSTGVGFLTYLERAEFEQLLPQVMLSAVQVA